ncbi:MAG TPA: hypothetical protein VEF04_23500 [Blastocatellia bacterium]|nr:hypothetical protein [Blastocatellia bacterium]
MNHRLSHLTSFAPVINDTAVPGVGLGAEIQIINLVAIIKNVAVVVRITPLAVGTA